MSDEPGVVGIVNLGNTCYMNAVIQILRSIPIFRFGSLPINDKVDPLLLKWWDELCKLINVMWERQRGVNIIPGGLFNSMKELVANTIYSDFGLKMPHDAHEYYTFLLDKIQQATHISPHPIAATQWHNAFKNDWSPIVPLLYGEIRRRITCHKCKTASDTYEVFNSLKVTLVDNDAPLSKSIAASFASEEIDGYTCDVCETKESATIQTQLVKTPQHLCITINRFALGFACRRKDTRKFSLDDILDITNITDTTEDCLTSYSLVGCIDHHGSAFGGHYECKLKHVADGPWRLYDDEHVYNIDKCNITDTAYMLFFRAVVMV